MPSSGFTRSQQLPSPLQQPGWRFPQPSYPSTLFGPLVNAIRRRSCDEQHLPTLGALLHTQPIYESLGIIEPGIDQLIDALRGQTRRTEVNQANSDSRDASGSSSYTYTPVYVVGGPAVRTRTYSGYRPPLPPYLRMKIESTLTAIEAEAVQLGKDIEMNQFRVHRRDPRGKEERVLGELRERCAQSWAMAIGDCVRDVEVAQTGRTGTALKADEDMLAARKGRGTRVAWRNSGKL